MITSKEYIHIFIIAKQFTWLSDEEIEMFDFLRIEHNKFRKEMEAYHYYPRHCLKLGNEIWERIVAHCNECGIKNFKFLTGTPQFRKKIYVKYYYKEIEITNLINI